MLISFKYFKNDNHVITVEQQHINSFKFNSGEWHIQFSDSLVNEISLINPCYIVLSYKLLSWDDMGHLMTMVNAIRNVNSDVKISLRMGYFPGGRQDRVANRGEPLTAKVTADIINSMNFMSVSILEPHSDVSAALVNNSHVEYCTDIIKTFIDAHGFDAAIIPDAGAAKRIEGYGLDIDLVQCLKTRDSKTGKLSGFTVHSDVSEMDVVIIDDICQGGGTFLGLYDKLMEAGARSVSLFVAHGFFDGDIAKFRNFKWLATTDTVRDAGQNKDMTVYPSNV